LVDFEISYDLMAEGELKRQKQHILSPKIVIGNFSVGLRNLTAILPQFGDQIALRPTNAAELGIILAWIEVWCEPPDGDD
jgi:hypothetical protein